MLDIIELKTCWGCVESLPLKEFYKKKSSPDGLDSRCKKCAWLRIKASRLKHRKRHLRTKREYNKKHRKAKARWMMLYGFRHPRTSRDLEANRSYCKKYHKRHPEIRNRLNSLRKARERGVPSDSTGRDLAVAKAIYGPNCVYCGGPATTIDHIIPLNPGPDLIENRAPACLSCNCSKHRRSVIDFLIYRLERGRRVVAAHWALVAEAMSA